jgi:cytoskeletal protein CcmA (bactofilin family)
MLFKSAGSNSGNARRGTPSILSAGFRVNGDIACDGEIHVAGTLVGNLVAEKLTLGESGSIDGAVEADTAIINGALQGRLAAVNVILGRSAQVHADVVYCSMRIEPGAVFEGFSRRVEREHLSDGEGKRALPSLKSLRNPQSGETASSTIEIGE